MFSVSQLSRVMSCPTQENLSLARQVVKYIIASLDLEITYRPDDPNDPLFCYPQRRPDIMKHLKDVVSWHTSAAS